MEYRFYANHVRLRSPRRALSALSGLVLMALVFLGLPVQAAGPNSAAAAIQPPSLFVERKAGALARTAAPRFTLRRMPVALMAELGNLSEVTLNLPSGPVVAVRNRFVRHSATHFEWIGSLPQDPSSSVLFVSHDGTTVGKIETGGKLFEIRRLTGGGYVLDEVDLAELMSSADLDAMDDAEPAPGAPSLIKRAAPQQAFGVAAPTVVDIMVLYDQGVLDKRGDVVAFINTLVAGANDAFVRSRVDVILRLVHTEKVEKGFTKVDSAILNRAFFDADLKALQTKYGADLVSILVKDPEPGITGRGFLNAPHSLVAVDYAQSDKVFIHEIGHNFGARHDRGHAFPNGVVAPAGTYNYGYRNIERKFVTIMAFHLDCNGCIRINNFSNPAVYHDGFTTGVADSADNARKLRETMASVAAWQKDSYGLTVAKTGQGRIKSDISAVDCGVDCTQTFPKPDIRTVTLTATPEAGWIFKGWSGACQGNGACVLVMDQDRQASALFEPSENLLSLSLLDLEKNREVTVLNGTQVFLQDTLPRKFTVQAKTMTAVSGIKFDLAGPQLHTFTSLSAPHTLFGSQGGLILPWNATAGRYNLDVTAYTGVNATGEVLTTKRIVVEFKAPNVGSTAWDSKPLAGFRRTAGGFAFQLVEATSVEIALKSLDGRKTVLRSGGLERGQHAFDLPKAPFGRGIYQLQISGAGKPLFRTLIHVL